MKQYELNRSRYMEVRKMDHQQMSTFINNIRKEAYEDGKRDKAAESTPENNLTTEKLISELQVGAVKAVGATLAARINEYAKAAGYVKAGQEEAEK